MRCRHRCPPAPGDRFSAEPYLYVAPHHAEELTDLFWDAPFAACLTYDTLPAAEDPVETALRFIGKGRALLLAEQAAPLHSRGR